MKLDREKRIKIQEQINKSKIDKENKDIINRLLDESKLGLKLYFEESEEKVKNQHGVDDFLSKQIYTYFKEDESLRLTNDENLISHLLMEGDNYFALKHLEKIGQKVDVIYIDPPYNTGSEFIYNDTLVNKDDKFKHSYWLSFMKRRLELARSLLSDEGVIFVSIDDNEQAYLKVLMDEIFGEENFVANINWQSSFGGKNDAKLMPVNTEYILCYSFREYFNKITGQKKVFKLENDLFEKYGKYNRSPLCWSSLSWYENLDFIIYVNKNNGNIWPSFEETENTIDKICAGPSFLSNQEKLDLREGRLNGNRTKNDWRYYWSKEVIQKAFEFGFIDLYKKASGEFDIAQIKYEKAQFSGRKKQVEIGDQNLVALRNVISDPTMSSSVGNKDAVNIFGSEKFSYPKPVSLIKKLLSVHDNNITILDFFAGSGTTGQAVMELNNEDGGTRRFIGVTLGEEVGGKNICKEIAYERLYRINEGSGTKGETDFKWIENNPPLKQNLKYININYLDKFDGNLNELNINSELYEKEFNCQLTLELIADE